MATREGVALGNQARLEFVFNDASLHYVLTSPSGPVGRDLARRAIDVTNRAKINASGRPGPRVDTGRLRASIAWRLVTDAGGLQAHVGTNVEYAYYLEVTGVGAAGIRYPFLAPALVAAEGSTIVR